MKADAPELKRIVNEVVGPTASSLLLKRILSVIDESKDPSTLRSAAAKVEKLVALFLGADTATTLGQSFKQVLG